ncbi:alpha-amylase family glycosyl hydrolase [Methylomagnum sp.]
MPFGTVLTPEGVRFRLWAPGTAQVELLLEGKGGELARPMTPHPDGWFEYLAPEAKPGSRYRFRLDNGLCVPDPVSRWNPDDVHGPSVVVDPEGFAWTDDGWQGRPWNEAVIYELHVGTFTPEGSFRALRDRLDYFVALGVTALEIMPVADFPGRRGWGYDGVLLFAPDASYGTPEDFKDLIDAAHRKGLMVFLDVVYNHFGPEGNYLYVYAQPFFSQRHHTPWGSAINFDGDNARAVRDFFIHNALYWLEEYRLDGLRLDAVHAIADDSRPDILEELADRVRAGPSQQRHIHLILENDANAARYLARTPEACRSGLSPTCLRPEPDKRGENALAHTLEASPHLYDAQWNDDFHHAAHILLTGETDGYYGDYAAAPLAYLGRTLTEGFAYQGEISPYRDGQRRGEPSRHLPTSAFVTFLQNHDQVGNRAFGERLAQWVDPHALRAVAAVHLLAPSPPLLFMGEEFASTTPFLYFCDFEPELAAAVTRGRREEFARFAQFAAPEARETIPDPSDPRTFQASKLDWSSLDSPRYAEWLGFYRRLLGLRQRKIVPLLPLLRVGEARYELLGEGGIRVVWPVFTCSHDSHNRSARLALPDSATSARQALHSSSGGEDSQLTLLANLGPTPLANIPRPPGRMLATSEPDHGAPLEAGHLPGWYAVWHLAGEAAPRG